jgi:hypothetical protein
VNEGQNMHVGFDRIDTYPHDQPLKARAALVADTADRSKILQRSETLHR